MWYLHNDEGRKFWIIFSLGLTGIFQKQPKKHSHFILNIAKRGKLKIDDKLEDIYLNDQKIYFDDEIKYGNIYFCLNKDEKDSVLKDVGFDLMAYALVRNDDRQVLRQYWNSLHESRRKNMKISKYVLEQKFF